MLVRTAALVAPIAVATAASLTAQYSPETLHALGPSAVILAFTNSGGITLNFDQFRRVVDNRITFYHLMSSAKNPIRLKHGTMVPLTLLPTALSSYVPGRGQGLYLSVNASLFQTCGVDAIGRGKPGGLFTTVAANAAQTQPCPALESAVDLIRRSGVVQF